MMIAKLRKSRGFTLVELMIVVAIIGILAALAIYGVRKYLTNAKTAEARQGIGRMAKDGASAYNKEGMNPAVLKLGEVAGTNNRLCKSSAKVPAAATDIKAQKYQSTPTDWQSGDKDTGWRCVGFSMADPQYFQYQYVQAGSTTAAGGTFEAVGSGDLDGDEALSTFKLKGSIQAEESGTLAVTIAPNIEETNPDE